MKLLNLWWAALCLAMGTGLPARAAPAAPSHANLYTAAPSVDIEQPVAGDLLAAAGRIRVAQAVAEDAALAAGDIAVQAPVGQDLRAAAGRLSLAARVGGDAHLAGGNVRLEPGSEIAGGAWIAGGDVQLHGRIGQRAKLYAGHLVLGGEVAGDLQAAADSIELLPSARIQGRLRYASAREARIADGAVIAGGIVREGTPERPQPQAVSPAAALAFWLLGLFAVGAVWSLLFPGLAQRAQTQLQTAPGPSLAFGALTLLGVPVAALLLMLTIIGAPLALALIAAYALALLAGFLVVAGTLAERLLQVVDRQASPRTRLGALALALLLLLLAGFLPVVGWLVALVALMAGTGALVRQRLHPTPA